MTCDLCQREIMIGMWPYCPHEDAHVVVIGDDIPGGMTVENGFDAPRTFYSHSAHRAALAAEGLELRPKWAGPHDRHMTRWDSVDLESARVFLESHAHDRRSRAPIPQADRVPIETSTPGTGFTVGDLT